MGGVQIEAWLAVGYSILLALFAASLQAVARRSHRRTEHYELAGFRYHPHLNLVGVSSRAAAYARTHGFRAANRAVSFQLSATVALSSCNAQTPTAVASFDINLTSG